MVFLIRKKNPQIKKGGRTNYKSYSLKQKILSNHENDSNVY